jgi:hypothetical protein
MRSLSILSTILVIALSQSSQAQDVTVTADGGPDESMTQAYMAHDRDCRNLVNRRDDPTGAVTACKEVADEADQFSPKSHYITRRAAYVFFATALIQAKKPKEAVVVADKAVAVVLLGHDDAAGSGAAYGVRGQARAFAGDLTGADEDFEKAETYQRNGLNSPAGQQLKGEYSRTLKGMLTFHAQILKAMGKEDLANSKLEQASKL